MIWFLSYKIAEYIVGQNLGGQNRQNFELVPKKNVHRKIPPTSSVFFGGQNCRNLAFYRKFCSPKNVVHRKFCPPKNFDRRKYCPIRYKIPIDDHEVLQQELSFCTPPILPTVTEEVTVSLRSSDNNMAVSSFSRPPKPPPAWGEFSRQVPKIKLTNETYFIFIWGLN